MSNYTVDLIVHNKSVSKYPHQGKVYVEGRKGSEFSIRLGNRTGSRVLAVVSVDGLSVMDGEEAGTDSSGYILDPFETLTVPGWRLDNEDVARFVFHSKKGSYAAQKGAGTQNVGIVGVAFFNEQKPDVVTFTTSNDPFIWPQRGPHWYEIQCNGDTSGSVPITSVMTCSDTVLSSETESGVDVYSSNVSQSVSSQSIGTGFGKRSAHAVTTVAFERCEKPAAMIEIFYDSRAGLRARGIDTSRKVRVAPQAFPRDGGGCEPPQGWDG